jgi:hypothetical protein
VAFIFAFTGVDDDDPIDGKDYSQRELDDVMDQTPIGKK